MARRRYLSTDISLSRRVNRLAMEHGDFAALLYTWLIPWAEDDCTVRGTPEQIKWQVCPGRDDRTPEDIEKALAAMEEVGLIIWDREAAEIVFPPEKFYEYQTYISPARRRSADQRKSAQAAAGRRKTPRNAVSFSFSLPNDEEDDVVNARARDGEGAGVPSPPPPVGADGTGVPSSGPSETGVPSSGSSADNGTGVPSSGPWPVPSGQDADPVFAEIERVYLELTDRLCSPLDWQDITKTLRDADGDAALIIRVMRRVAAEYKPKRAGDRIRAFRYFREAILDELARQRARAEAGKEVKTVGGTAKCPGANRGQDRGIADLMEG